METERSNLPADLPTLAREIDAALVRGGGARLPNVPAGVTEIVEQPQATDA